jgi:2-octaprenyl-6-methoxyphenol hydroxylase
MNFDITIIGGSFAGMTAALVLGKAVPSLKIAVVEKLDIVSGDRKRDGRAYAISSKSLQVFKEIGIYDELLENAGKIADIKITDYKSPFILDFIGREVDENSGQLGQIIENYHIHNALRDALVKQENITVFSPNFYEEIEFDRPRHEDGVTKVARAVTNEGCVTNEDGVVNDSSSGVTPSLRRGLGDVLVKLDNGEILQSKLLLACDGRFSPLRKKYNIHTLEKNYDQLAIVFNISHEKPHNNTAWEKFLTGGPLAILPFKNLHQSSIVWIAPNKKAKAILQLDEENFTQQLMKKMENALGEVKVISDKFSYPLIAIEAQNFYHEKMLLIGDAACGIHPIAGQGFNLAIAGIEILKELILENLEDISSKNLINSYNKKAKRNAQKMLMATDVLNSLFETKSLSVAIARDIGLGLVNKLPKLKSFFIKSAGGF